MAIERCREEIGQRPQIIGQNACPWNVQTNRQYCMAEQEPQETAN